MTFSTSEHLQAKVNDSWLIVYRLMCKRVLCIPEVFVYYGRPPHMERSFRVDTIYAPGPTCPDDANNSMKLYAAYRQSERAGGFFPPQIHSVYGLCEVARN